MTVVTAVTVRLGCPQRCHPSGEHPENAPHRRGIYSPFFRLVNPSCVRKIPGFFRQRLQGVTHYTLPARWCARRSLWTPLRQGLAIGAGIAVLTGIGAGLGIGKATSSAVDAIARQPEAESKISKSLLLGCALAEATAIYGFVIALLIILFLK